jgi:hypothetical protein
MLAVVAGRRSRPRSSSRLVPIASCSPRKRRCALPRGEHSFTLFARPELRTRRTPRILHVVAAAGLLAAALTGCGLAGGGAGSGADDGDRTITVIATDTPATKRAQRRRPTGRH